MTLLELHSVLQLIAENSLTKQQVTSNSKHVTNTADSFISTSSLTIALCFHSDKALVISVPEGQRVLHPHSQSASHTNYQTDMLEGQYPSINPSIKTGWMKNLRANPTKHVLSSLLDLNRTHKIKCILSIIDSLILLLPINLL